MPASLSTVTILDGNGSPIQVQFLDQSGTGLGAWSSAHIIIDGVAGVNRSQVTAANALKVDGSAVIQPVSGTISISGTVAATQSGTWTVTQSGTWTVQPGNTANTTAWLVGLNTTPSIANGNGVIIAPTAAASAGIAAVFSSALETGHVLKAGAGNLYGFEVTTTTAAGFVLLHNSTTVPGAGAVTPVKAWQIPANSSVVMGFDPPLALSTGISLSFSTATTPFTQTNSSTAFFSGTIV